MTTNNGRMNSALQNVEPMQVEALRTMQANDPETLRAMVTMANVMTRGETDGAEVASLACLTAPAAWVARRNGATVVQVMGRAVKEARKTLRGVRAADREWCEAYGDPMEADAMLTEGEAVPAMGRPWCPMPEARYVTGWADAVEALGAMVGTATDGQWLTEAMAAWVEYDRDGGHDGPGRRLTVPGAIARANGWTVKDAGYHASRRAVVRALGALGAMEADYDSLGYPVALGYGDPVPFGVADLLRAMDVRPGEAVPHGKNSARLASEVAHVPAPFESVVTVRQAMDALGYPSALGYGETVEVVEVVRTMTEREAVRVSAPMGRAAERTTAPERAEDHAVAFPGEGVHLPVRKVAPSPRKKSGTGATGPMVPGR